MVLVRCEIGNDLDGVRKASDGSGSCQMVLVRYPMVSAKCKIVSARGQMV